ncbi:MAG TPA: type II secretion system protein [Candidatus Saccharimonadales bacterium]|jgi:prepilin-type N-terminal cleavage/methylation domain-containing protein|nr:type II secretion system protein [Candidatus Saccharimonadales bacterium]
MRQKLNEGNKEKGFTIIEVMIVLAIAGLILLIIFLAVPALQRNVRNTQRKTDVTAIAAAVSTYMNDNDEQVPTGLASDSINANVLLLGTLNQFFNNSTLGNYEQADLDYYIIDLQDEIYGGETWYAAGFGQQANILSDTSNIFIVAMLPTATSVSTPTIVSASTAPSLPTGAGGDGTGGTINTESVSIITGETCNLDNTAAGTLSANTAAIFYVLEDGSGNGNLECLE